MPDNITGNIPKEFKSGEAIIDELIDDLMSVDTGDHTNSDKFMRLERALKDLCDTIQSLRAGNNENGEDTILTEEVKADLMQKYGTAIECCMDYTSRLFDTRSGYGEGRLQCAKDLQHVLMLDYSALKAYNPAEKKSLNHIYFMSRSQEVTLEEAPENMVTVGANSSVRIPLAITTEIGTEKGFFTEDFTHMSRHQVLDKVRQDHVTEDNGLAPFMDLFHQLDPEGKETEASKNTYTAFHNEFKALTRTLSDREKSFDDLAGDDKLFDELVVPLIRNLWPDGGCDVFIEKLGSDPDLKQRFLDLVQDFGVLTVERGMARTGRIEEKENIPDRNVGMSRIASMLGMGDLIAKAKRISLKDKDGNVRTGVFQEAEEFSDYNHLKEGDLLYDVIDHPEILDDPKILKQIANLQLLDYICGNTDRHLGNIMFNVQKIDGKTVLLGIKGIDNDRSLGLLQYSDIYKFGYAPVPEWMEAISKSAYEAICELTPERLRIALADLGISDNAIIAMMRRVQNIRTAVHNRDVDVLSDKEFAEKKLENFWRAPEVEVGGKKYQRSNTYALFKGMPNKIKNHKPDPAGPLKYNAASATTEPLYRRSDKSPIRIADLSKQKEELLKAVKQLEDTDSSLFKNSGSFKWVQSALESAVNNITKLETAYAAQKEPALSEKDTEVIDKCFRQIRLASGKYYGSHRNPYTPWGKARKTCAEGLKDLWPLRLAPQNLAVREISMDSIPGAKLEGVENNAEAPARKPVKGMRQMIRDAKRAKAAEGMTNNKG